MGRLFVRVFLWFWLGSTCLVVVFAVGLLMAEPEMLTTWRFMGRMAMRHLGTEVANVQERDGATQAAETLAAASREGQFHAWLYTADARLVAGPSQGPHATEIVAGALTKDDTERAGIGGGALLAQRTTSRSGTPYVIVWEAPRPRRWLAQGSGGTFAVRLATLLVTGGVVCWLLTWQITKPIAALRAAARRVADGDLTVRVGGQPELRRGDELADLAREFDQMAARIEGLIHAQQQLLADISHELRSPLARLSLALDLARRRVGEGVPEHDRIEREITRMNELIEQLLTLARLQGEPSRAPREILSLRDLVRDVVHDARFEAEAADRTVVVESEDDVNVRGSRALLRSAIENVVRNAVRHAPARSAVAVTMTRADEGRRVAVVVRDRGPGVPPDALQRLFDPFFRVDEARDRMRGGLGLGLAITRQAMVAHGGSASAGNHPEGGLVVRLELPTA